MDVEKELQHFLNAEGKLISYPAKRKKKLYALFFFAMKFEADKGYTEKEVNEIINAASLFADPATIRRELYDYRFLSREQNGCEYRLEAIQPTPAELDLGE